MPLGYQEPQRILSGTWKVPVRPGVTQQSFPKDSENVPDFSPKSVEKNPAKLEKLLGVILKRSGLSGVIPADFDTS